MNRYVVQEGYTDTVTRTHTADLMDVHDNGSLLFWRQQQIVACYGPDTWTRAWEVASLHGKVEDPTTAS